MKTRTMIQLIVALFALGLCNSNAQSIEFVEFDFSAEWVVQKNKVRFEEGTGIAVIRYTDLPGWKVQQSRNLVDWVDSTFLYGERESGHIVAIYPLVVDGERRQFFRLEPTGKKK